LHLWRLAKSFFVVHFDLVRKDLNINFLNLNYILLNWVFTLYSFLLVLCFCCRLFLFDPVTFIAYGCNKYNERDKYNNDYNHPNTIDLSVRFLNLSGDLFKLRSFCLWLRLLHYSHWFWLLCDSSRLWVGFFKLSNFVFFLSYHCLKLSISFCFILCYSVNFLLLSSGFSFPFCFSIVSGSLLLNKNSWGRSIFWFALLTAFTDSFDVVSTKWHIMKSSYPSIYIQLVTLQALCLLKVVRGAASLAILASSVNWVVQLLGIAKSN
jgi:hypothetical protein